MGSGRIPQEPTGSRAEESRLGSNEKRPGLYIYTVYHELGRSTAAAKRHHSRACNNKKNNETTELLVLGQIVVYHGRYERPCFEGLSSLVAP